MLMDRPLIVLEVAADITPPEEMVAALPTTTAPVVRESETAEMAPLLTVTPFSVLVVEATSGPVIVSAPALVTVKPVLT